MKSAAEAHRMLSNNYGEAAINEKMCREWFQSFKNGDFDVEDQHDGGRENWRHYLIKTRVKRNKNWQDHWE
ncbi:mariner Mos1 transposase [Trichonephila clavipes]|uniref:Mariner Mos1 transposase n=1 Tax=Trichonephila clavipes TaxID=2585209 RepID=A0A8X6V3B6_TRICX|nr:mariner Mos1 transposase [Trichonephila clavipes]